MSLVTAKAALKNCLKAILYHAGIAPLLARRSTTDALTIVMFHRVLPAADIRSRSAAPTYTMDLSVFEDCLRFLGRHYRLVSLAQVHGACTGGAQLPANAALITFDDGWEDTARYAAPALHAQKLPSVVFVTSGVLTCEYTLWRDVAAILSRVDAAMPVEAELETLPAERRNDALEQALTRADKSVRPLMMQAQDLPQVMNLGMAIGAHGETHTPLTSSGRVEDELRNSKSTLEQVTGLDISSFAFPHGRYNPLVLRQTLAAGYRLVFTSDSTLNTLNQGRPLSPVLGRIALSQADIADEKGQFSPTRAAFFLMFRKVTALDPDRGLRKDIARYAAFSGPAHTTALRLTPKPGARG